MLFQLMALVGAAMILGGYAGLQRGRFDREDRLFNWLNFVGSTLLGIVAVIDRRWGFIILEFVWAALSIPPLLRRRWSTE